MGGRHLGKVSGLVLFEIKGKGWGAWLGEEKPWKWARLLSSHLGLLEERKQILFCVLSTVLGPVHMTGWPGISALPLILLPV